ncbi:ribosomal pseudouridine synthase, putative [Perkinsus marinus ATCC 50983]|uniref:Ribosomal pseudouridine synthase, putative n=1 Tax=Perkinsus marinus (strain ATCC 50983 / TXsc) TaxID=423536 RepID=C5KHN4_PERM5|nr:ribosomal pseudouridine synthase, putative [Perkinsus marinus ATCC 50983]EER16096.1 ribosomal pseudouridine synthase, putative [Perkinsus marinus ATCC 50983]|eukprot:XP_002784300.1 ribosomal pseudouridine synthase, putative [Perkinsus marinus ATCC 50983]
MVDGDVISPPEDEFDVTATGIRAKRYTTTKVVNCKKRWRGRSIQDIISVEFALDSEYIEKACREGYLRIRKAGKNAVPQRAKPESLLKNGESLVHTWKAEEPQVDFTCGETGIVFIREDSARGIVAVHKPAGLPTHSGGKYMRTSLVHILARAFNLSTIRPINRLDRETSGVVLLAADASVHERLKDRSLLSKVPALCRTPIAVDRHVPNQPLMSRVVEDSTNSTLCTTLFRNLGNGVVACRPVTGKTHQIRVHLSHLGFPIQGDTLYGGRSTPEGRLRLHAHCYQVKDPNQATLQ